MSMADERAASDSPDIRYERNRTQGDHTMDIR
jgi:hypothetical protein